MLPLFLIVICLANLWEGFMVIWYSEKDCLWLTKDARQAVDFSSFFLTQFGGHDSISPDCRKGDETVVWDLNIFDKEEFISIRVWCGGGNICVSSLFPFFTVVPFQGLIYCVNFISVALLLAILFTNFSHDF